MSPLLREEKNWRFRFKRNYGVGGVVSRRLESETNKSIIVIFSRQTITKLNFQTKALRRNVRSFVWANRNVSFIFLELKFHPYQLVFAYLFIELCQFLAEIQQQREPATVVPWKILAPVRDEDQPQYRELRVLLFSNSVFILLRPAKLRTLRSCETGSTAYRPYPRTDVWYQQVNSL